MTGRGIMVYFILALAILFEIVGLIALKETQGFTRLFPALLFLVGLGLSFYFEAIVLKTLPISFTYAAWAGMGVVGMGIVGVVLYGEKVNPGVVTGMMLIVAGVAAMHIWAPGEDDEDAAEAPAAATVRITGAGR